MPMHFTANLHNTARKAYARTAVKETVVTRCGKGKCDVLGCELFESYYLLHNYLSINNKLNDTINQQEFRYLCLTLGLLSKPYTLCNFFSRVSCGGFACMNVCKPWHSTITFPQSPPTTFMNCTAIFFSYSH